LGPLNNCALQLFQGANLRIDVCILLSSVDKARSKVTFIRADTAKIPQKSEKTMKKVAKMPERTSAKKIRPGPYQLKMGVP